MKLLYTITLIFFLTAGFVSCKKYLDIVPDNVATIEYAFRNRNEAENYLFACYNQLQNFQVLSSNPGFCTSGELIWKFPQDYNPWGDGTTAAFQLIRGTQTTVGPLLDIYTNTYIAIQRCNTFLDNVNLPPDLTLQEKNRWIAEAKFLKAAYYFWLVRQYGPVPVLKENIPINAPTEVVRTPRAPVDSVFSYIVTLLDEALPELPRSIGNLEQEYGRATSIMALALKAKALVYQASPLFNGNPDQAELKNKDNTALFPTTADPQKWQRAADACKEAIDATEQEGVGLFHYIVPPNALSIPDSITQLLSIQGPITFQRTSTSLINEVIWPGNRTMGFQGFTAPTVSENARNNRSIDADAVLAAPFSMAELFYSNNGVPINEDRTWDYANRYQLRTGDEAHKYYVRSGYNTVNLHFNREPRFYADLSFDGGVWYGYGVTDVNSLLFQNSITGGNSNITGYWAKKLIPYTSNFGPNTSQTGYFPPVMRLADLYLLYAEALNEVGGPNGEVYSYIDSVRSRAGLKGVVESWASYSTNPSAPLTKEGLRRIIHLERRIELCFEGDVGWDLRRWKEYLAVLGTPIQGWTYRTTGATTTQSYYVPRTIFRPALSTKDYFWPYNDNLLLNNPQLVQNLYW